MPDLIADAFDCVGEELARLARPAAGRPGSTARSSPTARSSTCTPTSTRWPTRSPACAARAEAAGYRRYVDFVSQLYRYEMQRLHRPQHRLPARPAHAATSPGSSAVGGFRRLAPEGAASTCTTRARERVFSFQAMYAGLSPYDALAIYAVIAYMDSVAGRLLPARRHARGAHRAGRRRGEARRRRSGTARDGRPRRDVRATGRRRCITADGERIACDVVVLNPDLPVAYRDLLGREPWSVRRLRYSPSCFLLLAGSSATLRPDRAPQHPLRPRLAPGLRRAHRTRAGS